MVTVEVIEEPESLPTVQCTPVSHSPYSPHTPPVEGSNLIPVTPLTVGKVMSRDDAFYMPHTSNPFTTKFKDCNKKVWGKESWASASLLDFTSPLSLTTPPCTPITPCDEHWMKPLRPRLKRSQSLPSSPTCGRREMERIKDAHVYVYPRSRHNFASLTQPRTATEEEAMSMSTDQDSLDARSDGGSSNDSAVDLRMRDVTQARLTYRFGYRKYSVESAFLPNAWDSRPVHSRTELMARCMEARLAGQDPLPPHKRFLQDRHLLIPEDRDQEPITCLFPRSCSSSESFISLDESCSLLSPTSSLSSYSEDAELFLSRGQMDFYDKLHSRQRFQELVSQFEAKQEQQWKEKQAAADKVLSPTAPKSEPPRLYPLRGLRGRGDPQTDPHPSEKKFQELKKRWESKQDKDSTSGASDAKATGENT